MYIPWHDYPSEAFPQNTIESLDRYVIHGIPPGGFCESLVIGDYNLARGRADEYNRQALPQMIILLPALFPEKSFGSYDKYVEWLANIGNHRSNYAAEKKVEYTMRCLRYGN